jgi:integrase
MATKSKKATEPKAGLYREEWPRIRGVTLRGVEFFQCDGRPHFTRKTFATKAEAETQAGKWENTRVQYGKAGQYISQRDATKFAEAIAILAPDGLSIVDAARHYKAYVAAEKLRASSKPVADALTEWVASYDVKDRDHRTRQEIKSVANIYTRAFGHLKLSAINADMLKTWNEGYEAAPGKPASPQTRANLRTKLSQFLNFSKLKGWIENNPLAGIKTERPARAPVSIFEDVNQVARLIAAADKSEHRAIVLPYALVSLFAGLRPNSEAELLEWKDVHFGTGDIHVLNSTSKTKLERFVPMEANLIAWLETCPIREPGPIIGKSHQKFRMAWEEVKRAIGFKVGLAPEKGWPALAREWPSDITRHTYASYWLAVHKNRAELAERMGNTEAMIKKHYRRAIREESAKAFWAIMPKASKGGKIIRMEGLSHAS